MNVRYFAYFHYFLTYGIFLGATLLGSMGIFLIQKRDFDLFVKFSQGNLSGVFKTWCNITLINQYILILFVINNSPLHTTVSDVQTFNIRNKSILFITEKAVHYNVITLLENLPDISKNSINIS